MRFRLAAFLSILAFALVASGRDLHVDPAKGDDAAEASGGPFKTIAKAMSLAQAGDVIHLEPNAGPYLETILIRDQSGEPGKPITIDGHGATLSGCDPLRPADWEAVSPGLYKSSTLFKSLKGDDTVVQRMFFLFDGRQQLMGRTSKGAKAPWKKPEELQSSEWTFEPENETFYIKIDPSRAIDKSGVEIPYRAQGVSVRGKRNEHWLIRNLTVKHVRNDGFNLHTNSVDMKFENIAAYECGDDGFSAHEGCQAEVDGYRASGNSTGFANGFPSEVKLRNAYLFDNHATELLQMHESKFDIANVLIETTCPQPVVIRGNPAKGQVCRGTLDNIVVRFKGSRPRPVIIEKGAVVKATRITTIGLTWQVEGEIDLTQSALLGGGNRCTLDIRPDAAWKAGQNAYAMHAFSFKGQPMPFDAYAKAAGDADSKVVTVANDQLSDLAALKSALAPCGAVLNTAKLPIK